MGNTRVDKLKKDKDRKKLTDSAKRDGKRENSFKEGEDRRSDKEDSFSKEAAKNAKKEEKEKQKREAKEAKEERKKDKKRRSDERKEKEGVVDSSAARTNSRIQIYTKDGAVNTKEGTATKDGAIHTKLDSVTSPRAESSNNITANVTVQASTSSVSVNKESPKDTEPTATGVLVTPVNLSSPSDTNGTV